MASVGFPRFVFQRILPFGCSSTRESDTDNHLLPVRLLASFPRVNFDPMATRVCGSTLGHVSSTSFSESVSTATWTRTILGTLSRKDFSNWRERRIFFYGNFERGCIVETSRPTGISVKIKRFSTAERNAFRNCRSIRKCARVTKASLPTSTIREDLVEYENRAFEKYQTDLCLLVLHPSLFRLFNSVPKITGRKSYPE